MLLLIDVPHPPDLPYVRSTGSLPDPCSREGSGYIARVGCAISPSTFADWMSTVQEVQPGVPIAAGIATDWQTSLELLKRGVVLDSCFNAALLENSSLLVSVIEEVRNKAVPRLILEDWRELFGLGSEVEPLLEVLASVGADGGGVQRAARQLDLSEATLRRRLQNTSSPGRLLRDARLRSVELRIQLGWPKRQAVRAAGWLSAEAYHRVRERADGLLEGSIYNPNCQA